MYELFWAFVTRKCERRTTVRFHKPVFAEEKKTIKLIVIYDVIQSYFDI